jgi:hypothetical protein
MTSFANLLVFEIFLVGSAALLLWGIRWWKSRITAKRIAHAEQSENEYSIPPADRVVAPSQPHPEDVGFTSESSLFAPVPVDGKWRTYPEYDFWKGEPPDWQARRRCALNRDGNTCQVAGCPSIEDLDVHHIDPVERGVERDADHRLENLVTLCLYHHFLADNFHAKVAERISSPRYNAVPRYFRENRRKRGNHAVEAHVQRKCRASAQEMGRIKELYGLTCYCGGSNLLMKVYRAHEGMRITCPNCVKAWLLFWGLAEEVGPQLAMILKITRDRGSFPPSNLKNIEVGTPIEPKLCKDCAQTGNYSILIEKEGKYGRFWGCPTWSPENNHRGESWRDGDEELAEKLRRFFS